MGRKGAGAGCPARMTFIAAPIMLATSVRFAGTISVFPALARLPNWLMYCSATRSWTASNPPGAQDRLGHCAGCPTRWRWRRSGSPSPVLRPR